MKLMEICLSKLKEPDYNPRIDLKPGMKEFEKLRASIEAFGDVEPIVWNQRTGNIVGGSQRLAVLRHMGRKKALVSVIDLDENQEKLLNLALNKAKGDWDVSKLEALIDSLDIDDIELTGFGMDEIAVLMADNEDLEDEMDGLLEENDTFQNVKYYGTRWLVVLKFPGLEEARAWVEKEKVEANLKDGTVSSVVIVGRGEV